MTAATAGDQHVVNVTFDATGHVATLLIDRQHKLNALTLAMLDDIISACRIIEDSSARVVVIRSAGSKVFSVGADINHFADLSAVAMWRTWVRAGHHAVAAIESLRQPSIAVVDGLAYGGGFELALAADFRVLNARAALCFPETRLGTVPGWGGTGRLVKLVGTHRASDMILTRRILNSTEALEWGIATRVSQSDDPDEEVNALVDALLGGAPIAVQIAKQLISAAESGNSSEVLEALGAAATAASNDLTEGIAAFREKRTPAFHDH